MCDDSDIWEYWIHDFLIISLHQDGTKQFDTTQHLRSRHCVAGSGSSIKCPGIQDASQLIYDIHWCAVSEVDHWAFNRPGSHVSFMAWYLSGHAWSPQSCCLPVGWRPSGVPAALLAAPKAVTSSGLQQQMLHDLGRHYPHHHCPSFNGPHATTNRKSLGRSNLQFIYNQADQIELNSVLNLHESSETEWHACFLLGFLERM